MHQGSYKHTIDDIQERTGLSRHFINRCSSKISDILDTYRQYGDNNQLFYDDSGLLLFDQIAQLKREGKTIPEIKDRLANELQSQQNSSQSDRKTSQNNPQNLQQETAGPTTQSGSQDKFLDAIGDAYREVAKAKDEVIKSKDETINSLQQNLRLLTDGRSPERVKKEHEKKVEEAAQRRQEIEQLREENRRRKEQEHQHQKKREQLLAELKSLEGKWFSRGRRQDIITALENLDQQQEEGE